MDKELILKLVFIASLVGLPGVGFLFMVARHGVGGFFFSRLGRYGLAVVMIGMGITVIKNLPEIESKIPVAIPAIAVFILLFGGGISLGQAFWSEEKWQQRENEKLANHD